MPKKIVNSNTHTVTYKFRLYPNIQQKQLLLNVIAVCRFLYNTLLELHNTTWENFKVSLSKYDLLNRLPELKREHPQLQNIYSQVLQNVACRVSYAFQRFFDSSANRYPKFKSAGQYLSFTYPQSGFHVEGSYVILSKIGGIKVKFHRQIVGELKTCTVKHKKSGAWYIYFTVEQTDEEFHRTPKRDGVPVGIDLGIIDLATLSDETKFPNNRHLQKSLRKLKRAQRKLSRKSKGGKNRRKARKKVARLHEKVSNQRKDYNFKTANFIVNHYSVIAIEEISPKFMLANHKLARAAADASWAEFRSILEYEADKFGREVVPVPAYHTSQMCSGCGAMVIKPLSERTHSCPFCGLTASRDVNAAINILNAAINRIPSGRRESTPIEIQINTADHRGKSGR